MKPRYSATWNDTRRKGEIIDVRTQLPVAGHTDYVEGSELIHDEVERLNREDKETKTRPAKKKRKVKR